MIEIGIGTVLGVVLFLAVGLVLLLGSFFTVEQNTAAVVERFGKFVRVAGAGLNFKVPLIESVAGDETLRVQQLVVEADTKTLDNVFVAVKVTVQYAVMPEKVFEAFYRLEHAEPQITSYVLNVVRAAIPAIKLDNVFDKKDAIAQQIEAELQAKMAGYGYSIIDTQITDIDPDATVKASMNAINAAQRNQEAATAQGEANRILAVKNAEAEAQAKALQGKGVADQRKAIISGFTEAAKDMSAATNVNPEEVLKLVLLTAYFDMLRDLGAHGPTTILLPSGPGGLADLEGQIRNAIITGNKASA